MFSGIIRYLGIVVSPGQKLSLRSADFISSTDLKIGDSVAVNGVCLTVVSIEGDKLEFDVVSETLRCSKLGELSEGDRVNLESSLKVGDSVDGHFVQGHVDTVCKMRSAEKIKNNTWKFTFTCDDASRPYICPKGSVAIDGVSLTVGEVSQDEFSVYVIPHTFSETTLSELTIGSSVNIEYDCLARYVVNATRN